MSDTPARRQALGYSRAMYRLSLFPLAAILLLCAPPAHATGQEMAGLEVVLITAVSLIIGGVVGSVLVVILLLSTWRSGLLKRRPWRVALMSAALLLGTPVIVYLGFVVDVEIRQARQYPGRYDWLTGRDTTQTEQPVSQPDEPSRNPWEYLRYQAASFAHDIVIAWHRDSSVEEQERRASQGGEGAAGDGK
ncbi:MAG: hypothetical protein ACRES4_06285 [Nevskiales bacterium]